jgi:hypothetical protein
MTLYGSDFVCLPDADLLQCCSLVFDTLSEAPFDLAHLHAVDVESPLWRYCAARGRHPRVLRFARPSRTEDRTFELQVETSFDEYLSKLGPKSRSSLRRRAKKLCSEQSATLVRITSAEQVPSFLEDVNTVFSDSWQAKAHGTSNMGDTSQVDRLKHIADQGWLRSYLLTSNVGPLAFQIGYQYGDTYYGMVPSGARGLVDVLDARGSPQ